MRRQVSGGVVEWAFQARNLPSLPRQVHVAVEWCLVRMLTMKETVASLQSMGVPPLLTQIGEPC